MRSPAWLTLVFAGLTSMACSESGWQSEKVKLGVGADLSAVEATPSQSPFHGYVAVGASGAIVSWESKNPRRRKDRFIRVRDIGDRDLRALSWLPHRESLIVVGDGGTAALSDDFGDSWTSLELDVDADLHAILYVFAGWVGRTLILGDDVVLNEQPDGTWAPLPPPEGGWGDLRAGDSRYRTYLVGLEGVVWQNAEPFDPASPWIRQPTGTTADLFAVDSGPHSEETAESMVVVGSQGMLLIYDSGTWERIDTGRTADFIRYSDPLLLTDEGEILELDWDDEGIELEHVRTFPGALGFDTWPPHDKMVVGVDGLVMHLYNDDLAGL